MIGLIMIDFTRCMELAESCSFVGTYEEKLAQTRQVRDAIKTRIEEWLQEIEKTH